ncbi:lipopolysaccharide biosynthesis protein [Succinivibrio dextrinosolvens]|uniref:lipopolysaccharide biosynthesis protein n=1 Tax=Succinivibrio dextrinosolvens TaxID=83771 RepID=UPI0019215EA2|nr:oligosaccharide flippase family protein [Succinivibrio dextrinosolvens]
MFFFKASYNFVMSYLFHVRNLSLVAKTSLSLVLGNLFQKGLLFISYPIFTRIMPPSEFGIISTYSSWQNILFIVFTLNLSCGGFNNGMHEYKDDRIRFLLSMIFLSNLCTLIWGMMFIYFYSYVSSIIDLPRMYMWVMFLYFLFNPAYCLWMGMCRFESNYKTIIAITFVVAFFSTSLSIIFVLISPNYLKAYAKILGTDCVPIIIGFFVYIYVFFKAEFRIKLSYWKYILRINVPLIPHYLSFYVLSSSDRIMISKYINTSSTALYSLACTIVSFLMILWNSIDSAYAPWVYQKMDDREYELLKKRSFVTILFFGAISIMSSLLAPEFISILGPEEYSHSVYVIPSVVCGVYFSVIFSMCMRIELYLKKSVFIMVASILCAIINIILNYLFIPKFGYVAAGYTTLFCYIILAVFHSVNLKIIGFGFVYDFKKIYISSFFMILSVIFMPFLYEYTYERYVLILLFTFIIFFKRRLFLLVYKK